MKHFEEGSLKVTQQSKNQSTAEVSEQLKTCKEAFAGHCIDWCFSQEADLLSYLKNFAESNPGPPQI